MDELIVEAGRRRLEAWLPEAREAAERGVSEITDMSSIMKAVLPYINEDNFHAVAIYPGPKGGWLADILLKSTPIGISNAVGSPVQTPFETRSEAVTYARGMLERFVALARRNREAPAETQSPAFVLYGYTVVLKSDFLKTAAALKPADYPKERAIAMLEEGLAQSAPDGFTGEAFDGWSIGERSFLMTAIHLCTLFGIFRYPLNVDKAPKEEAS
jgi:hypothetical protein